MVPFRWHCLPFSSPGRAAGKGRRFFSPPLQHLSLSPPPHLPKNPAQRTPHYGLPPWWKGQRRQALGAAAQGPPNHLTRLARLDRGRVALSPFPTYKYLLTRRWESEQKKMKKQKKNKGWKGTKKKGEENRGWKEERNKNEEEDECRRTRKKTKHIREEKEEKKKTHREEEEEPPASEAPAPPSTPSWALPLGQLPPSPPLLLLLL